MLSEQREVLHSQEGLYSSVALIVNFFLSFPKKITLQQTVLTIFRRLYNQFPVFRKPLEDPLIMVLINIQHKHSEQELARQTRTRSDDQLFDDALVDKAYEEASRFVNYLLQ